MLFVYILLLESFYVINDIDDGNKKYIHVTSDVNNLFNIWFKHKSKNKVFIKYKINKFEVA